MIPVHYPVMSDEVLDYLAAPLNGPFLFIDGTLGEGGHARRILESYPDCRVVGIDADRDMLTRAGERLEPWKNRFEAIHGWTDEVLASWQGPAPDAVLMDLGISSFHYGGSNRGFSFRVNQRLDMRLDELAGTDAAELVNSLEEEELADLIYRFGEERYSRRIARRIVERRRLSPIQDTETLAGIVVSAMPEKSRHGRIHAATRTFQALRIAVNRELERLARLLDIVPSLLASGGRFGVISFHSLEDRLVKGAFRSCDVRYGGNCRILTKKPLVPSDGECRENPASRSAKFRVLERAASGGTQ